MKTHRNQVIFFFLGLFIGIVTLVILLKSIFIPLTMAYAISYILNPTIKSLEAKGVPRIRSLSYLLVFIIILILGIILFVLPYIVNQLEVLIQRIPFFIAYMDNQIFPKILKFSAQFLGPLKFNINMNQFFSEVFQDPLNFALEGISKSIHVIFYWAVPVIITPVFSFLILKDYEKYKNKFYSLIPLSFRTKLQGVTQILDHTLRSVLKGQILIVGCMTMLYCIGFMLCDLPAALVIGIITGFARLVPYLDIFVGLALTLFMQVTNNDLDSWLNLLWPVLTILIIQGIDGAFLTPKILGQVSGLPPLVILISIFVFGDWLGVYGVLLAVPTMALIAMLLKNLIKQYRLSYFYMEKEDNL
jgi:predicted PurR-regulated permease PerM